VARIVEVEITASIDVLIEMNRAARFQIGPHVHEIAWVEVVVSVGEQVSDPFQGSPIGLVVPVERHTGLLF